jgi:hypothetical protein
MVLLEHPVTHVAVAHASAPRISSVVRRGDAAEQLGHRASQSLFFSMAHPERLPTNRRRAQPCERLGTSSAVRTGQSSNVSVEPWPPADWASSRASVRKHGAGDGCRRVRPRVSATARASFEK